MKNDQVAFCFSIRHNLQLTGDDHVDGELDPPVRPSGRDGDVMPLHLLWEQLQRAAVLVRVL